MKRFCEQNKVGCGTIKPNSEGSVWTWLIVWSQNTSIRVFESGSIWIQIFHKFRSRKISVFQTISGPGWVILCFQCYHIGSMPIKVLKKEKEPDHDLNAKIVELYGTCAKTSHLFKFGFNKLYKTFNSNTINIIDWFMWRGKLEQNIIEIRWVAWWYHEIEMLSKVTHTFSAQEGLDLYSK